MEDRNIVKIYADSSLALLFLATTRKKSTFGIGGCHENYGKIFGLCPNPILKNGLSFIFPAAHSSTLYGFKDVDYASR